MNKYICRHCGITYEYCRGCLLSPISYKENGFCSKACQETYQNKIEEVVPSRDVAVVVMKEDTSTPIEEASEYPYFFTEAEEPTITTADVVKPKKKRAKPIKEIQKENEENGNKQDNGEELFSE